MTMIDELIKGRKPGEPTISEAIRFDLESENEGLPLSERIHDAGRELLKVKRHLRDCKMAYNVVFNERYVAALKEFGNRHYNALAIAKNDPIVMNARQYINNAKFVRDVWALKVERYRNEIDEAKAPALRQNRSWYQA